MKACPSCHSVLIVRVRHRESTHAWACLSCFSAWAGRHLPLRLDLILGIRESDQPIGPMGEMERWAWAQRLQSLWPKVEAAARKHGGAWIPWKGKRATWP